MNVKVSVPAIIVAVFVCALVSCVFVESAKRNLGLSPDKQEFENFSSAKISRVAVSYLYPPPGFSSQEIRFVLRDQEVITRLQKLFKIKSVSPYTLGVHSKIVFDFFDEKNRCDEWKIDFKGKNELLFAHNDWKANRSCAVVLKDDSFYEAVFALVCENNKRLFPMSSETEISLCF